LAHTTLMAPGHRFVVARSRLIESKARPVSVLVTEESHDGEFQGPRGELPCLEQLVVARPLRLVELRRRMYQCVTHIEHDFRSCPVGLVQTGSASG
jgi:hypothetical protein